MVPIRRHAGRWSAYAALGVALALAAGSAASNHSPPAKTEAVNAQEGNNGPSNLENAAKPLPLVVEAHVSGNLETTSKDTGQKTQQEENRWLDPITIFTGLLVLVGAAQVMFLRNADKAVTKSAEAAKISADALVSQLRPYLSIKVTEGMRPRFDPVTGPWCALTIRNNGQTPAYELTFWLNAALGPPDYEGPFPHNEGDLPPQPMTLAPSMDIQILAEGPPPRPGDADRFAKGEMAAYVFGEVNYIDPLKNPRFYRFRYIYTAEDIRGGVFGVRLAGIGNEAN